MNEWQQLMEKHAVQEDKSLTVKYTNKKKPWDLGIFHIPQHNHTRVQLFDISHDGHF